jgi:hypothetical protein
MQKKRIANLSTRYLGLYKNGVLTILVAVLGWLAFKFITEPTYIFISAPYGYLIYRYILINRKVFHVEFDEEFLYLIQKEADVLIPLQNIKSVELKTMGGLYEIKLYSPEIVGDLIYYKPSLLYPFNFKAKDAIAYQLRRNIEKAKRRREALPTNALIS